MKAVGIIPARFGSTRFPGKPLAMIAGLPMIRRVYERAMSASNLSAVIVATDDKRIADTVRSFSGAVCMTSDTLNSGTERIIEASAGIEADIYVNIQGDEPLISPRLINSVVGQAFNEKKALCVTAAKYSDDPAEWSNTNVVKTVLDGEGYAMYFSRSVIPYPRSSSPKYLKHLGIYTYTKALLEKLKAAPVCEPEAAESLEQLRILFIGEKIKVVLTDCDSIAVDIPDDIRCVENILSKTMV